MYNRLIYRMVTGFAIFLFCIVIHGCSEEEISPEMVLEKENLYVGSSGGTIEVSYSLSYPRPGAVLSALCDVLWIRDLDCKTEGLIRFKVDVNEAPDIRTAVIGLNYPGITSDLSITVVQAAAEEEEDDSHLQNGLHLQIHEVLSTSVTFSLKRDNPEMAYILEICLKEDLVENGMESDEDLWLKSLELYQEEASIYNETLEETIMNQHAKYDDLVYQKLEYLYPESEYVIYAFGIDVQGNEARLLTEISREVFFTPEIEKADVAFALSAEVHRAKVSIRIEPVDYVGPYFADVTIENLTAEEATTTGYQTWQMLIAELQMYGYTTDQIIDEFCITGPRHAEWSLNADTDYTAYAFAVNPETAMPYSDASAVSFRTEEIGPSDNLIDIEITDVKARSFMVTATPSNQDPYFSATLRSSQLEGLNEEEIIQFMIYNYTDNTVSGAFSEKVESLEPETEYSVVMFGLEGGVATTCLFRKDTVTTVSDDLSASIEIHLREHYDIAAAAVLDPAIADYQSYGDAFLHVEIETDPEDIPAYVCYFTLFSLDEYEEMGLDLTDDLIINNLLLNGSQSYKDKMIGIKYGDRMFAAAVIADNEENVGPLFKTDIFIREASDASDPQKLLDWLDGILLSPSLPVNTLLYSSRKELSLH